MHRSILILLLAASCALAPAAHANLDPGDMAIDAVGKDRHGNEVTMSGLRGKVVILTFWASWCAPCRKELPILDRLQQLTGPEPLAVVAVNYKEDAKLYRRMLRRDLEDFSITLVHDRRGKLSDAYGVRALPHMFIIDHTGRIAYEHLGYTPDMLDGFVEQVNGLLRDRLADQTATAPAG